jgi:hypothetical protein
MVECYHGLPEGLRGITIVADACLMLNESKWGGLVSRSPLGNPWHQPAPLAFTPLERQIHLVTTSLIHFLIQEDKHDEQHHPQRINEVPEVA